MDRIRAGGLAHGLLFAALSAGACGQASSTEVTVAATPSPTPDGWGTPVLLGEGGSVLEDAYSGRFPPTVALGTGPSGTIAAWIRRTPHAVVASRFTGGGWDRPATISSNPVTELDDTSIAMDAAGNAMVVWGERPSCCSEWRTHASRYDARGAWGPPQAIQRVPSATYATRGRGYLFPLDPKVVMDPGGRALAFWDQSDAGQPGQYPHSLPESLSASRFSMPSGWAEATSLSGEFASGGASRAAAGGDGSAFVVWMEEGVRVARFDPSDGWEAGFRLAPDGRNPDVAADGSGNAVVAMATGSAVMAQRFEAGREWAELETIWSGLAVQPRLAMNTRGQAVLAWIESSTYDVWASRFAPDEGWGKAVRIGEGGRSIDAAVDAFGHPFVIWEARPGPQAAAIATTRFEPRLGWSAPHRLAEAAWPASGFSPPRIVADARGDAFAAWSQYTGTRITVLASRFVAPAP